MRWPSVAIAEIAKTGSGTTPSREKATEYYGGTIPWVKSGELRENTIFQTSENVTEAALRETSLRIVPAESVLVAMYGATVGRVAILGIPATTNQAVCHIIPDKSRADARYLLHALQAANHVLVGRGVGGAQPNISQQIVSETKIPLPPLPEQRRIAAILDHADALLAKRRAAIAKLDSLAQSIFLDMFGDPAANPKNWPLKPLGSLALRFSDGPFGSNLKSEHYKETGIRVIRLQNIGVGQFLDADAAYVSESHFAQLSHHTCLPGDVLIGTLGDPNLRACVLPDSVPKALNKADCVQMRPNPEFTNSAYITALLNTPSVEVQARSLIQGQTRLRISMGRLRNMLVPCPPIESQRRFKVAMEVSSTVFRNMKMLDRASTELAATLQVQAFQGDCF